MKPQHWQQQRDAQGNVHLLFDLQDHRANVLTEEALTELAAQLEQLAQQPPCALLLRSAKPAGFIAGADVHAFVDIQNREQADTFMALGQRVANQLADFPAPTLCLIDGHCLGGGLELALACHWRIASDHSGTRLGLPEVKLGILPGFGGTLRLAQRIPATAALAAVLQGRLFSARQAKRLHLVDAVVPRSQLENVALYQLAHPRPSQHHGWREYLLNSRPGRQLLAHAASKQLQKHDPWQHYPAPRSLLTLWPKQAGKDRKQALAMERETVSALVVGETSRQLVRVFHLREKLKSSAHGAAFTGRYVHVFGAGVMGADIAIWCALQGLYVSLQDPRPEALAAAMQRAWKLAAEQHLSPLAQRDVIDRLLLDPHGEALPRADVVIEAIIEDEAAKRALLDTIEDKVRPDTLITSNTSSIPLERLAASMQHPQRFCGLHFFNPVAKMPLVEVVHHADSDPLHLNRTAALVLRLNKLPLPVRSSPGFLVNRVLMPYLLTALNMIDEGIEPQAIDNAALAYGMPLGPVALADQVGLDICLSVARVLQANGIPGHTPACLSTRVEAGQLGCKTGHGFYDYPRPHQTHSGIFDSSLQQRLLTPLIETAEVCLQEGVVEDADLVDAGMIFGTGFAPFRGGPMQQAARPWVQTATPAQTVTS